MQTSAFERRVVSQMAKTAVRQGCDIQTSVKNVTSDVKQRTPDL